MAAAQAGSALRLGALRAAEADLDPGMARGLALALLVKAFCRHAVSAWEGVGETTDRPLPFSSEAAELVEDTTRKLSPFDTPISATCAAEAVTLGQEPPQPRQQSSHQNELRHVERDTSPPGSGVEAHTVVDRSR